MSLDLHFEAYQALQLHEKIARRPTCVAGVNYLDRPAKVIVVNQPVGVAEMRSEVRHRFSTACQTALSSKLLLDDSNFPETGHWSRRPTK